MASFSNQTTFTVGTNPFLVQLGDINSDGKLDLVEEYQWQLLRLFNFADFHLMFDVLRTLTNECS